MTLQFKDDGGVDRAISEIWFMDDVGADHEISIGLFGARTIYATGAAGSITVDVTPPGVGADANKTGSAMTDPVVATPTGGTAPYTYLWTIEDAIDGVPTINSPTAATTTFSISGLSDGTFCSATARCTVTDVNSFTGSGACSVTFYGGF